ncbi:hypothetical protein F5888DRAFT_1638635 [Russula emetica]|nr:hypothetical protein F5888DRAFT_1638635 [Russula emetica]
MSSYRRWTRDQEDIDRLPHGMVRTAYDADTQQYTFHDTTDGTDYISAPGAAYGTLVPVATANFPKTTRTTGRKTTLQAYDRPVFFADDLGVQQRRSPQPSIGHKRNPTMPASSRHHTISSSGSTRKQGHKRSASFSDILPPHLIARASNSSDVPTATATSKPRFAGARGGFTKSAPPSPPPPPPPYGDVDEKKRPVQWSTSPTDPLSSLPTLSASPPPLPPKDYPPSSAQQKQQQSSAGETFVPHVAMRLTARVLGRTLGAAKGAQRSPKVQSGDDGWVVV